MSNEEEKIANENLKKIRPQMDMEKGFIEEEFQDGEEEIVKD